MFHASLTLSEWLAQAAPQQRDQLAKLTGSHANHIYQIATGRRNASAAKAADIEAATRAIEGLPPVPRTQTCRACTECPYAKRCANGPAGAA